MTPKLESGGDAKSPTKENGASSKSTVASSSAGEAREAFAPPRAGSSKTPSSSASVTRVHPPSEAKNNVDISGRNSIAEKKKEPPATKKASATASSSTSPHSSHALPPPSDLDPPITVLASELRIDDPTWLRRYQELIRYRRLHGHVDVPRLHSANLPLASWVHNQRKDHKRYQAQRRGEPESPSSRSHMTKAKVKALERLGFKWDLHGAMWDRRYDELCEFREEEGHVDVPQRYAGNPSLGRWVNTQRLQQRLRSEGKKSDMTPERYAKLSALGMVWYVKGPEQWNVRFDELLKYKQAHGNCEVPSRYGPNRKLGRWVSFQRTQYRLRNEGRHSHLTEERMKRLEDVGFSWTGVTASVPGKSCVIKGGGEGGSAAEDSSLAAATAENAIGSVLAAAGESAARAREKKESSSVKPESSGASMKKKKSMVASPAKKRENKAPTKGEGRAAKRPRIEADPDGNTDAAGAEAEKKEMDKTMAKRLKEGSEALKELSALREHV